MHYTATYSPDDNNLRIYGPRFDDETYQRVMEKEPAYA